ncbi:MAG: DUF2628 domain-containing protein [Rickettsiales bacterium]|jgi:hypothetical protein|nr:DUF2628 domain-containing protein [Rickettsiales bacterium]
MKIYNIFVKENEKIGGVTDVIVIKSGFSPKAAIFNIFWFLSKGMWWEALLYTIAIGLTTLAPPVFRIFIIFIFSLAIGFFANYLEIRNLDRKRNYYFVGSAPGRNKREARLNFLEDINRKYRDKNQVIY